MAAPAWATDPDVPVPVGYQPADGITPEKFFLGAPADRQRAAVLCSPPGFWRDDVEKLIPLAAGAWKAVCGVDCGRDMAEFVARSWIECVARTEARSQNSTIILGTLH